MVLTLVGVVGLSILISASCSLLESVLYSTRRITLQAGVQRGDRMAVMMEKLKSNVDSPLAAILILNTIANTAGAAVAGWAASQVWGAGSLWVFSIAFTLAILFFSEILPKTVGAVYWRGLWRRTVYPLLGMVFLLYPLIFLTRAVTRLVTGRKGAGARVSEEEILAAAKLGQMGGEISEMEHQLIRNIIYLEEVKAADIMTPRTVLLAADGRLTAGEVGREAAQWPFSRVPIYEGNLDQVVGYVLKYEVMGRALEAGETRLTELAKPLHFVPASANALNLLKLFLGRGQHVFGVVDEYGGLMGLVTLEDVLESLVGSEIVDESDVIVDLQELARQSGRAMLEAELEEENDRS